MSSITGQLFEVSGQAGFGVYPVDGVYLLGGVADMDPNSVRAVIGAVDCYSGVFDPW